jgi:hypothetical protein
MPPVPFDSPLVVVVVVTDDVLFLHSNKRTSSPSYLQSNEVVTGSVGNKKQKEAVVGDLHCSRTAVYSHGDSHDSRTAVGGNNSCGAVANSGLIAAADDDSVDAEVAEICASVDQAAAEAKKNKVKNSIDVGFKSSPSSTSSDDDVE